MRLLGVLLVLTGCSTHIPHRPWRPAPPLTVEETAAWFMQAALAGDEPTARQLTLSYDELAAISSKADQDEWERTVKQALDEIGREGDGEQYKIDATVVEHRKLDPASEAGLIQP